jgi:hypothetical protein
VRDDSLVRPERRRAPLESRNQGLANCFPNAQNKKGLMLEHQASRKSVNEKSGRKRRKLNLK